MNIRSRSVVRSCRSGDIGSRCRVVRSRGRCRLVGNSFMNVRCDFMSIGCWFWNIGSRFMIRCRSRSIGHRSRGGMIGGRSLD